MDKIINDAREALLMDRFMSFEEWYPAWMVNENGELINNQARLKSLRMIFDGVMEKLGIK